MLKNSAGWAVSNTLAAQPPSGGADTVKVQMVACQACEACAYFSCRMPVRALECEASPVFLSFARLSFFLAGLKPRPSGRQERRTPP